MQQNTDPDAPCECRSGIRYADCHQPIFNAPKGKAVAVGQQRYASEWALNAEAYRSQGLYGHLAKELAAFDNIRRILDIGCGLGQGVQALRSEIPEDRIIIGIDENPECLRVAAEGLGLPADNPMLRRLVSEHQLSGFYRTTIKPGALDLSGEMALANVDTMLPDPEFEAWLDDIGDFDAITLWFAGVHKARSLTKIAQQLAISGDADYREVMQERQFQLAERHLRPGGLVHIVARLAGPDLESLRAQNEQTLASALADWPFEVVRSTIVPYVEPNVPGATQVKSKSFDASGQPTGAFSIFARWQAPSMKVTIG